MIDQSSDVISSSEIRATKTMLLVIICFLTSWVPLTIKLIIDSSTKDRDESSTNNMNRLLIENLCLCAIHFHSAADAVIFAYRIKDVRTTFFTLFKCKDRAMPIQETANPSADTKDSRNETNEQQVEYVTSPSS